MPIGALVAFQTLLASFNQPFRDLARLGSQVQELRADLDRIDDVRHHRLDPVFEGRPAWPAGMETQTRRGQPLPSPRLSGHLELRDVTFGYNRTVEEPLIKGFSMIVRPGQRIALVGGSGSGKTTIARLIMGLYQPWSGLILHDGKPIAEIPRELFVNSVAMVDERIAMFQGTVRDNLTLWDELISSKRLIQAGLDAAIHRDLLQRRGGYDAVVAEGARNFSGGQRQRLEIARSLVRDPSLLILDEATSALDPKTEAIVDDHLRRRGCTCLIIAHRLTTIRDCDEIIVLSAGRVVQRGTHDQLLADSRGEYSRLLANQDQPGPQAPRLSTHLWKASPHGIAVGSEKAGYPPPNSWPKGPIRVAPDALVKAAATAELNVPRFLIEELLPFSAREETAANSPLPLDDPESVWWVTGGQVDVFFTLPGLDGGPGRRRHLCRVEEGGSIFAVSGVRGHAGGGLMAVGVGTARLLRFARGDLIRLGFEERLAEQVAVLIDDWILRVGRALSHVMGPLGRQELALANPTELAKGTRYGVREGVAWIRHLDGSSLFLEEVALPVTELEARFPLSEHLWLTAGTGCRVTASDTLTMVRTGDPWAGLKDFHRAVLDDIGRTQERDARQRWEELRRAADGDRALVSGFSIKLAAVANQTAAPISRTAGDALLAACRTVGQEKGIEVRQPRKSTDDDGEAGGETLEDIARSSGFHIRQVTLEPGWASQQGGEPLLARLADEDNRPVALLPTAKTGSLSATRYDLYDPVTDRRLPVVEVLARRIAPAAWMFYPTLPDHPLKLSDLLRFILPRVVRELRFLVLLAILGGLLGLAVPIGSGILVDQVIPELGLPEMGHNSLLVLCLFLVALAISTSIFQVVEGMTLLRIEGKVVPSVVPAVWDRLLRLPTRFYAGFSSGDLALRAMGLSLIFKKVSGGVVATLVTGLVSLFNLGLLFWYSWRLALISALLVGIMLAVIVVLLAGQLRQEARIRKVEGSIISFLLEIVGGMTKLRTAGAENRAFGRWAAALMPTSSG